MVQLSARPLAVRDEVALSEQQLQALRTLAEYDLSRVRNRLQREVRMPMSWLDEAVFEFRRYLGLVVVTGASLQMFSKPVDDVWHTCLLFSRLYMDLCQQVFGRYLHHEPAPDPEVARHPMPDALALWQEFEAAYGDVYGELTRLWVLARDRAATLASLEH